MERRKFINHSILSASGIYMGLSSTNQSKLLERKFKLALNPGIIGVKANLQETIEYAIKYGYEAISPFINEVLNYSEGQLADTLAKMKAHKLDWDSTNIPVEWRQSKTKFNEDFKQLKKFVQAMEKIGAARTNTWIISSSNDLTYSENMKQTSYRLRECAKVMKDHGVRLGIEYLGMRTLLTAAKYPFMCSLKECKELIHTIGESNVGVVLDTFHWYCAGENGDDLKTLQAEDISHVDLNDARLGFERIAQQDGKRELPMATGVINTKEFMQSLVDIGFDGPLRTEPFNQALNEMDNDAALKTNMDSLKKAMATVGMS